MHISNRSAANHFILTGISIVPQSTSDITPRKMSTRLIAVDDTSPRISYQGPWTENNSVSDTFSNSNGDVSPFNNTLHRLSGSGSFSFFFTGISVSVISSFDNTLPSWTCYIDGNTLVSKNISNSSFPLNNVEVCALSNITKTTPSNLTVSISITPANANSTFLLDYIQYAPVASTIIDDAILLVDAFDSQIQYDSRWNLNKTGGQVETSVQGASMTFDFVGDVEFFGASVQITWIAGSLPFNASTVNSSASYSIDNGTLFPFLVTSHNSSTDLWAYFQTGILSPGSHSLFVEYNGVDGVDNLNGSESVPLILDHFVVQSLNLPPAKANKGLSTGAIAGIVIGSLVGLTLIIIILIWTIRRFFKGPKNTAGPDPAPRIAAGKDGH